MARRVRARSHGPGGNKGKIFVCSVALGVFFLLAVFLFGDGCWTMYRSHTSSLVCHLPMAAICMHQLANSPVLCNMQSNVLNDRAKAKRRGTGKKST